MNNPNDFLINTDFASSGNDNSSIITVSVPAHTLTLENTYTNTATAISKWSGKQIRAQITITTIGGVTRYPGGFCTAILKGTYLGSDAPFQVFMDVSRITNDTIRLRVITYNYYGVPSISVPAFTVEARVRTVIGN